MTIEFRIWSHHIVKHIDLSSFGVIPIFVLVREILLLDPTPTFSSVPESPIIFISHNSISGLYSYQNNKKSKII